MLMIPANHNQPAYSKKDSILKILLENCGCFVSGALLTRNSGLSRAGVWKHVNSLRNQGYVIGWRLKRRALQNDIKRNFQEKLLSA